MDRLLHPQVGEDLRGLNVSETDDEITITAEVPGVDPNDVQIEIEGDVLTLRAKAREVREEGFPKQQQERSVRRIPVEGSRSGVSATLSASDQARW